MEIHLQVNLIRNKFIKAELGEGDTYQCRGECPLCGESLVPFIRLLNSRDATILERSVCPHCTFVTLTKIPTQQWFKSFYGTSWDQRRNATQIEQKLSNPYDELFDIVMPYLKSSSAKIFEIGVGYGACLNQFIKRGFHHLYGIEASEKRFAYAKNRFDFNLAQATSETMLDKLIIAQGAPYDLIYAWHTMEHVYDLNTTMEGISQLIRPGGLLFFGVPQFYEEHLFSLAHFLPHIHSFTKQSMLTLLNKHGFEVISIDEDIRVLARKIGKQTIHKAESKNSLDFLNQKFERDLCLEKLDGPKQDRDLLFLFSNGKPQNADFKKCRQWVIPTEEWPSHKKFLLHLQKTFNHGITPTKTFDWRSLESYNPRELFGRGLNKCYPIFKLIKKGVADKRSQAWTYALGARATMKNGSLPVLNISYPSDRVCTWLK